MMQSIFQKEIGQISLFVVALPTDVSTLVRAYVPTADEYAALEKKTTLRQKIWLAERLLLRDHYGDAVTLEHHDDGAPYLTNTTDCLSISHTKTMLAVAFASCPIGIDLEQKKRCNAPLLERIFSADEKAILSPNVLQTLSGDFLTSCWTSKEAVFKLFSAKGMQTLREGQLHFSPIQKYPQTASFRHNSASLQHFDLGEMWLTLAVE